MFRYSFFFSVLLQLLRTGGPELLDDLSLAKQCKIGEIMSLMSEKQNYSHALDGRTLTITVKPWISSEVS